MSPKFPVLHSVILSWPLSQEVKHVNQGQVLAWPMVCLAGGEQRCSPELV